MYKLCRSEQSARRQRELELGLLELMVLRPFDDISVSDLCDYLQIPRKSFYRYFSNKEGALTALLDHTLMEFEQTAAGNENAGRRDLEGFFVFWYQRRGLLKALFSNGLSGMLVERATYHAIHERMMPVELLGKEPRMQQLMLGFAICGLISMLAQWHLEEYRDDPDQMARIAVQMLTKPLVTGWG